MKTLNGTIIKGIGGFYYVEAAGERCDFSTQISPVIVRLVQVRG